METSRARSAPVIGGLARTRSSSSAGSGCPAAMAARMAPRSRRCRVSARVPLIAMPGTSCALSSSSRVRADRQLDATLAGSRIT